METEVWGCVGCDGAGRSAEVCLCVELLVAYSAVADWTGWLRGFVEAVVWERWSKGLAAREPDVGLTAERQKGDIDWTGLRHWFCDVD